MYVIMWFASLEVFDVFDINLFDQIKFCNYCNVIYSDGFDDSYCTFLHYFTHIMDMKCEFANDTFDIVYNEHIFCELCGGYCSDPIYLYEDKTDPNFRLYQNFGQVTCSVDCGNTLWYYRESVRDTMRPILDMINMAGRDVEFGRIYKPSVGKSIGMLIAKNMKN